MADSSERGGRRLFGKRALHTGRKGLQNKLEERAGQSDKAAVRRERFVGSTFCTFGNVNF